MKVCKRGGKKACELDLFQLNQRQKVEVGVGNNKEGVLSVMERGRGSQTTETDVCVVCVRVCKKAFSKSSMCLLKTFIFIWDFAHTSLSLKTKSRKGLCSR